MTAPQNPKANGAGAKRPPQIKKALPTVVLVAILFVLGSLPGWMGRSGWMDILRPAEAAAASAEGSLRIHVIDVGQGDSILIDAQGEFMLIDGGERGQEDTVVQYLRDQGVEELRYVVATHPHTDHIGGLAYGVLAAFPVGEVIAPRLQKEHVPGSRTYEAFLAAVTELARTQGTKASYARPGLRYPLGEAAFTILAPLGESVKEQNNNSVVLRLDYGKTSALFTGDAEKTVESALVEEYGDGLRADLLKAGHHGSNTSSNALFLYRVQPKLVAVSAGAMNDYGHPKPEMLARCLDAGAAVYRTDLDGTIVFAGDGTAFWVVT